MEVALFGLLLAFIAGLSTTIGGLLVFAIRKPKNWHLSFSLAFSAGVMITVSFIELLPSGIESIGYSEALIVFFLGAGMAFLIDYFLPHTYIAEKVSNGKQCNVPLLKTGVFLAIGLAIHNFPEGFAIFAGNLYSMQLGLIIAIAIAIHNIPEGIAVAIPVWFATKSKKKALWLSFLSGMAEPVGALIALAVLMPFLSKELLGASLAFVAGIMVYICIDELLPVCYRYCENNSLHIMTFGFFAGSAVMGATLVLLA